MYFPIGWPKTISLVGRGKGGPSIRQIVCNRDKILFAILTDDSLYIYFCKPCLPIVCHTRNTESIEDLGPNELVAWRPDSTMLVVVTSSGSLVYYRVAISADQKALYEQVDSPQPNLRRDSAELFIKEVIPPLHLSVAHIAGVEGGVRSLVCIRDELMLATTRGHVLRYRWDGQQNRDYSLDLRRVPFCLDQQVTKAVPLTEQNTYIIDIEYSPLVGGFAVVLNDGRAAFLTASSLRFDPNQVQGIWAPGVTDATCASVNHKYRLLVFGRSNSQCVVFTVDESSGGLEVSHRIVLSSKDYPGAPGGVSCIRWTPDASAMAVSWERGGISLWSTFGALLMCTLGWDYGLHVDLSRANPLVIGGLEWCAEGYQLWMIKRRSLQEEEENTADTLIQLEFVKSPLTVNPCMSLYGHLYLQGEDKLYINLADSPGGVSSSSSANHSLHEGNSKQWLVVPIPSAYSGTNWPIRYTAIDAEAQALAVAGRTGLAHYSLSQRKWKLFGNETQEKDFVVTGGLLWWRDFVLAGCYSIPDDRDEIRVYPREAKLDKANMTSTRLTSQALLLNLLRDRLIAFCADAQLAIFRLTLRDNQPAGAVELIKLQSVDVTALCVHPACVTSITLTSLRPEAATRGSNSNNPELNEASILINVSGRLLMVQHEADSNSQHSDNNANREHLYTCVPATVLASCVEHVWVPGRSRRDKLHLTEALWLYCGAHGMRVWLPLWPRGDSENKTHTFMAKRIMLPFQLKIYPLAILFEDAIILGAENDTILYTSDSNSPFSLPFCVLEKTSQVYLHQILRQLIRRNLGYHAWEIARSCTGLPYFPHSLELLLHEVLEEEATSKEPIPDALLPSVVEFIQEFPVYLQTVVQCARKTEIALWPYLFAAAGKPKALFQECMSRNQLDTAASYLIILQNLEPASVSRQHATLLLDAALSQSKWELSKELVRFLRAIDPNDAESPRASFVLGGARPVQTPAVGPTEEDLALVLGTMQVSRGRSFSTTISPKISESVSGTVSATGAGLAGSLSGSSDVRSQSSQKRKKSVPTRTDSSISNSEPPLGSAEDFFLDVILQRHARRLLSTQRIADLGYFAAHLDFHLVSWLARERDRAARIDDPIATLKQLHADFNWPYPQLTHPVSYYLQRKSSQTNSLPSTPTVEEHLILGDPPMSGSRVGDSGYMSFPGGISAPTGIPEYTANGQLVEAHLMPHLLQDDRSVFSDDTCAASLYGDDLPSPTTVMNPTGPSSLDRWTGQAPSPLLLEQLAQEMSARGSPKAEVQLRYLFQLVLEAGCLEWALLIAIVLRDALAVFRTTTAVRAAEQSCESIARLRETLATICQWSAVECLGYKPFMLAVQSQLGHLAKLLSTKQALQQVQVQQQQATQNASSGVGDSPPISRRSRQTSTSLDGPAGGGSACAASLASDLTRLSVSDPATSNGGLEETTTMAYSDVSKQVTNEIRENETSEARGCVLS